MAQLNRYRLAVLRSLSQELRQILWPALRVTVAVCAASLSSAQSSAVCADCHQKVWETYQKTGMGHSFYRLSPRNQIEDFSPKNTFYHQLSGTYFTMLRRGEKYFILKLCNLSF